MAGDVGPFGPISVAPNLTTSQKVSTAINQSFGGSSFSAGSYVAGQQAVSATGGGTSPAGKTWGTVLVGLLGLGFLYWLFKGRKKSE